VQAELSAIEKTHYKSLSKKEQGKQMAALEEKLAEAVRQFPVLCDKSCRDLQNNRKKKLAREDASRVRHLECFQMKARLTLKARLTIPLTSADLH